MKHDVTRQQWLVWCCWVAGMDQAQTAASLQVTVNTVKNHRSALRRRLGPQPTERTPTHA